MTKNGLGQCRNCDQCEQRKRRHWLGRIAAESHTASHTLFVTLTYDDKHVPEGLKLPLEHPKNYYHSLRRKLTVKQFTVGEYGDKTGRPHWHAIQFYYGEIPDVPLGFSTKLPHWARGNSQYEVPRSLAGSASYVYDYLDKGGLMVRPSPGLGKQFLLNYARMIARNKRRLFTQFGMQYAVPGVNKKTGGSWKYYIPSSHHFAPALAEAYLAEWLSCWDELPDYDQLKKVNYDG